MLNIENIRMLDRQALMVQHQILIDLVVVAFAVVMPIVELVPLIDYVVQAVAEFAPNSVIHLKERIHYVMMEMAIEIVVEVENKNFDLSIQK